MDNRVRALSVLLKVPGNQHCADCGSKDVTHASYNIGIFLCETCAGLHGAMGSRVSKVKHLKLDHWEMSQIDRLKDVGNVKAKLKYEARVPNNWRRPTSSHRDSLLLEHWINAKYSREEFISGKEPPPYSQGIMEGHLFKRARENNSYHPRKFVLDGKKLKYYVKETKSPKATLSLQFINLFINPPKMGDIGFPCMQLDHMVSGSTRHLYVYHEDPEMIAQWYHSILIAKFDVLKLNDGGRSATIDHPKEGWLWKAGPVPTYTHRKRWFTLDNRKLMYHVDPFDAYPKGEIFLGEYSSGGGWKVIEGGFGDQTQGRCSFSVHTPQRTFILSSETEQERSEWVAAINHILNKPMTQQDRDLQSILVRKRSSASKPLNNLLSRN